MKYLLSLAFVLFLGHSAYAQSSCCTLTYTNGTYTTIASDCDSNSKTPSETVQCKLDYWKKKLESLQKDKADIESNITKAQERVQAFTDAQRK